MKELLLMRHAKAVASGLEYGDLGRPLNGRGRRAAAAVAGELHRLGTRLDLVLCSPSRRTRETLGYVLEAHVPPPPTRIEAELYMADSNRLIDRFRRLEADIGSALLIGHNEGLAQAAIALATAGDSATLEQMRGKFPTGALAWLRLPLDDWTQVGRTAGDLHAFIRPRDLAASG
jgi:phosphohistidine phosphatase